MPLRHSGYGSRLRRAPFPETGARRSYALTFAIDGATLQDELEPISPAISNLEATRVGGSASGRSALTLRLTLLRGMAPSPHNSPK